MIENPFRNWKTILALAISAPLVIFAWLSSAPFSFPSGAVITVSEGAGLYSLAAKLEEDKVIRSPLLFRVSAMLMGGERDMKAGEYYMTKPQSVFIIAWRVLHGRYDIENVRVTIPEGFTSEKIANLFEEKFEFFDKESFLASITEGHLFPDTYFVPVTATSEYAIRMFENNFERKVEDIRDEVAQSGKDFNDILIMASIIEGEARAEKDMKIISGILWKRIEIGMPLQVDATFVYLLGKGTSDLTRADLETDSPYNTYLYKGLPPTPISNPGLAAIRAALSPTETEYLYFLTGDDGKMHYSKTHDEHVAKKSQYIKNGG